MVAALSAIKPGPLTRSQTKLNEDTQARLREMFTEIARLNEHAGRAARFGETALATTRTLRRGEPASLVSEKLASHGGRLVALKGLADFISQCATNGESELLELAAAALL